MRLNRVRGVGASVCVCARVWVYFMANKVGCTAWRVHSRLWLKDTTNRHTHTQAHTTRARVEQAH